MEHTSRYTFLSYAHEDGWHAVKLAERLLQQQVAVWWDRYVQSGDEWRQVLDAKLTGSSTVIVLWSQHSRASPFVRDEASRAAQAGKLIQIVLDHKEVPLGFGEYQYTIVDNIEHARLDEVIRACSGFRNDGKPIAEKPAQLIGWSQGLPQTDGQLFGRADELDLVTRAWRGCLRKGNDVKRTNTIVFHGKGGCGKSAILSKFINDNIDTITQSQARLFVWSAHSQGASHNRSADISSFFSSAFRALQVDVSTLSTLPPRDRGVYLANLLQKAPSLVVLDGIEPLQNVPTIGAGRLKDPALASLIETLSVSNPGLLIISSRQPVAELQNASSPRVLTIALPDLDSDSGLTLLKSRGIHGSVSQLDSIVKVSGGHALTLTLAAAYLAHFYAGDARYFTGFNLSAVAARLAAQQEATGQRVRAVMDATLVRLKSIPKDGVLAGGDVELNVMKTVALFDRPAPQQAIHALLNDGSTQNYMSVLNRYPKPEREGRFRLALRRLKDLRLIEEESEAQPGSLSAHPLIRDYFSELAQDVDIVKWRQSHESLYVFYKDLSVSADVKGSEATYRALCFDGSSTLTNGGTFVDLLRHGTSKAPQSFFPLLLSTPGAAEAIVSEIDSLSAQKDRGARMLNFHPQTDATQSELAIAVWHARNAACLEKAFEEIIFPRLFRGFEYHLIHSAHQYSTALYVCAQYFDQTWETISCDLSPDAKDIMMMVASMALNANGQSVDAFRLAVGIHKERVAKMDWENAGSSAAAVARWSWVLGDLPQAITYCLEAISIERRQNPASQDPRYTHIEFGMLSLLSYLYFLTGQRELSENVLNEMLDRDDGRWNYESIGMLVMAHMLGLGSQQDSLDRNIFARHIGLLQGQPYRVLTWTDNFISDLSLERVLCKVYECLALVQICDRRMSLGPGTGMFRIGKKLWSRLGRSSVVKQTAREIAPSKLESRLRKYDLSGSSENRAIEGKIGDICLRAIKCAESALQDAKQLGEMFAIGQAQLAKSKAFRCYSRVIGDGRWINGSRECLDEVYSMASHSGMRLVLVEYYIERAWMLIDSFAVSARRARGFLSRRLKGNSEEKLLLAEIEQLAGSAELLMSGSAFAVHEMQIDIIRLFSKSYSKPDGDLRNELDKMEKAIYEQNLGGLSDEFSRIVNLLGHAR